MATIVQSNTYQLPSTRQFKVFGKGSVDTEASYTRPFGSLDNDDVPPSPSRRTRGSSNIQYGAPGVKCRRSVSIEHAMGDLIGYDNDGCEVDLFDEPEDMERGGFFFEEDEGEDEDDYATLTQNGLFLFKEDATLVQVAPAPVLASYLAEQAEAEVAASSATVIVDIPDSPTILEEIEVAPTPASSSSPSVVESEPVPVPTPKATPPAGVRSPPTRSATLQALRDAPPPPPPRLPPPLPPRTPSPVPRILISPPDEHEPTQGHERDDSVSSVSSTSSTSSVVVEATKVMGRTTASVVSVAALAQVIVGPHLGKAGEKLPLLPRPTPPTPSGSRTTLIASVTAVLVLTPALLLAAHFIFK